VLPLSTRQLTDLVQGVLVQGNLNEHITGVAIDHRQVQPGDLFVAFVGEKHDGHDFVADAFARGAAAALVTKDIQVHPAQGAVLRVADPLIAIGRLAAFERTRFGGPVIGVTGSNGKTTTKDLLAAVFRTKGPCLATAANYNNELGLPLTLLGRQENHQSIILEMGMRGLGQIQRLCDIAQPTAGIITNIGQSHIEILGSQENIAKAKGELLEALPRDGVAVLSLDDPWLVRIAQRTRARVLWTSLTENPEYAEGHRPDAFAEDIRHHADGVTFVAHVFGERQEVSLPTYGRHNVGNALGALLMGAAHALPLDAMAEALAHAQMTGGRLQVKPGLRGSVVIDDTYNASPLSTKASLSALKDVARERTTVAILGEMYELGTYAEASHREVGAAAAELGIDRLVTIGPMARWIAAAAKDAGCTDVIHFEGKQEALAHIDALVPDGAAVLVKASRGMKLEDVVRALTQGQPTV
jgi:UDP-N-acetylmuramoyl-tripeptide--D-alanyl-D-alanine ligase